MKIADRVKETTTTTGTGTYTLAGAAAGFRSFSSAFSNADVVEYAIDNGTDWEVGYGTFTTAGTTLTRGAIRASSNANAAVNWSAGTKNIWANAPAVNLDPSRPAPFGDVTPNTIAGTTGNFSGTLTAQGLIDASGGSAGQIKFPGTQNASADVNTLDDYEEGTWTPGLAFGGGTTGITYSAQYGTYTKIGNRVFCDFRITLSSKGSSTGTMTMTGLPFTTNSNANYRSAFFPEQFGLSGATNIVMQLNNNVTTCSMFADGGSTSVSDVNMTNTGGFWGQFHFTI